MSAPEGQPETTVLEGHDLRRIVIDAPQGEAPPPEFGLLLGGPGDDLEPRHGQPSRLPRPVFRFGHTASAAAVLA